MSILEARGLDQNLTDVVCTLTLGKEKVDFPRTGPCDLSGRK